MGAIDEQAALVRREWETSPRWAGVRRDYSAHDVVRLRGGAAADYGVARGAARHLWALLHSQETVLAGGGNQPRAVYLPGSQAADGNLAVRPDLGQPGRLVPVVAGADSPPDAFELMRAMIGAGVAGVRFDDQRPAGRWPGRPGGPVLVPVGQHIATLSAARLAADVLGVPSLVIARTAAGESSVLTADSDERDHEFLTGERTADGLFRVEPGLYACGTRALAFAPYADLLWLQTPVPDLAAARAFACVIHSQYPGKLLAYSCAPSFDWRAQLDGASIATLTEELALLGYRFQLVPAAAMPAAGEPSLALATA